MIYIRKLTEILKEEGPAQPAAPKDEGKTRPSVCGTCGLPPPGCGQC